MILKNAFIIIDKGEFEELQRKRVGRRRGWQPSHRATATYRMGHQRTPRFYRKSRFPTTRPNTGRTDRLRCIGSEHFLQPRSQNIESSLETPRQFINRKVVIESRTPIPRCGLRTCRCVEHQPHTVSIRGTVHR